MKINCLSHPDTSNFQRHEPVQNSIFVSLICAHVMYVKIKCLSNHKIVRFQLYGSIQNSFFHTDDNNNDSDNSSKNRDNNNDTNDNRYLPVVCGMTFMCLKKIYIK